MFQEVESGAADFGVVPIENSTDGRIVDTLDMFTRLPLRICGEVQLSVHHNLLAKCGRSEITEIYSKPQAFSQWERHFDPAIPETADLLAMLTNGWEPGKAATQQALQSRLRCLYPCA